MLKARKSYKKFPHLTNCRVMGKSKAKIIDCKALPNYKVWVHFEDGLQGIVDLNHLVGKGVFSAWESVEFFNSVRTDSFTHTLCWGEDIDLDPYVLREKVEQPI